MSSDWLDTAGETAGLALAGGLSIKLLDELFEEKEKKDEEKLDKEVTG